MRIPVAESEPLIQDAADGPGELTRSDAGKVLVIVWENGRGRVVPGTVQSQRLMVAGGGGGTGEGGTSTIAGAEDFGSTLGADLDGYVLTYDFPSNTFILRHINDVIAQWSLDFSASKNSMYVGLL